MQSFFRLVMLPVVGLSAACSANVDVFGSGGGGGEGTSGPTATAGPGSTTGGPSTSPSSTGGMTTVVSSSTGMPCMGGPDDDIDLDGFSPNTGDCNDCDPGHSPNNLDFDGNGLDDDCDGAIDQGLDPCDQMLAIDEEDAMIAASAIELCKVSSGPNDWGVVSAAWVLADGMPPPFNPDQLADFHLGHGLLDNFGSVIVPRAGARMLGLSNENARDAADPDYEAPANGGGKGYTSAFPDGGPKPSVRCGGTVSGAPSDPIALQVIVRAPDNAEGFAFDSYFFAADFPVYVCDQYDDTFFALLEPPPLGLPDGQIAYYPNGNPISLNGAPFDVCSCAMPPCMAGGKTYACAQGDAALAGTGFEMHAATGWQTTASPVVPGSEVTLRLGIYDATDGIIAATALVDAFKWLPPAVVIVQTVASP